MNTAAATGYKLTNTKTGVSLMSVTLGTIEEAKAVATYWRGQGAEVLHLGTLVEVVTK